ncbi:MAG: D-lyxose/D-mannose family sugar isomerase [Verrucomicrobiota bacterium]|nr:D-lyxose/D-mannose family sugar isomerase [Verrucomicrobiota bacterium]
MKKISFKLPKWAFWSMKDWENNYEASTEIFENMLGWDITDFGQNDYDKLGLFLFTIRNGQIDKSGKTYAEKIMISKPNQITPMHFHWSKMEDIINRGGGKLALKLYNATENNKLDNSDVNISIDGIKKTIKAGSIIVLEPGESICLEQRVYHSFWAEEEATVIGEVSMVNDDNVDNCFYEPMGRFPEIEEDEEPMYLLVPCPISFANETGN